MTAVSPARRAAFKILLAVERGSAHSDEALRGDAVSSLSRLDRNLATALVMGVLRWQVCLDQQCQRFLKRPNAKLDTEVRIALRLGAFQLLYMDKIPAHAAIDESVEWAKQAGHQFAARMVNAVLRKLAQGRAQGRFDAPEAYPQWMVERWRGAYGVERAHSICAYGQTEAMATIRLVDAAAERELQEAGIGLEPGELLRAARRVTAGDVTMSSAFREGRVRLQDEGSQLVAEIAGHGEEILDACAAPGGKTLVLSERNPDAKIVAYEMSPTRLAELRDRFAQPGQRIDCRGGDASAIEDAAAYDLVLADVPCSGTGTLGRNPEIRHRLRFEDLSRQADRQGAILRAALQAVRAGGRVVYSTCSLEPEENEGVIGRVLETSEGAGIVSMRERIESMGSEGVLVAGGAERLAVCMTPEGCLRLLPGDFGTDGFFVAMLQRVSRGN